MNNFLNPEQVLNQLDLDSDMIGADFGSGSGGFTIPLALKLDQGLVHALDVQQEPLSSVKSRAFSENVGNIRYLRCDLEKPKGSTLADSSLDIVLICNILFQSEDRTAIISEAKRVLKNKGQLLVVDWLSSSNQGPETRVSLDEVKKIANGLKLEIDKEFEAGKYHYGIIFKKP